MVRLHKDSEQGDSSARKSCEALRTWGGWDSGQSGQCCRRNVEVKKVLTADHRQIHGGKNYRIHGFRFFNSGFVSSVCEMKPRRAAHRSLVEGGALCPLDSMSSFPTVPPELGAASCAMFFANRSLSLLSSLSFLFIAPGFDFMLFRLMMLTWSSGFDPAAPEPEVSSSGKASARASRVVTSFLFGRRRLVLVVDDFVILLMRCACLIRRLSFFEAGKRASLLVCEAPFADVFFSIDFRGCAVLEGGSRSGAWNNHVRASKSRKL